MADGVATRFLLNPLGVGWMTKYLESLVPLGAGFSLFDILNVEYRTRNFEQQKFLKGIRHNIVHFDILRFLVLRFCGSYSR